MFCQQCGATAQETATFCSACGKALTVPSAPDYAPLAPAPPAHAAAAPKKSSALKTIVIVIVGVVLLGACISAVTDDDAASITSSSATRLANVKLSSYSDNVDSDGADEIVAYIELEDIDGRAAKCDCVVQWFYGDEDTERWTVLRTQRATPADFERSTVGRGAFERDALLFATFIEKSAVCRTSDFGVDLRVSVTLAGSLPVEDNDYAIC